MSNCLKGFSQNMKRCKINITSFKRSCFKTKKCKKTKCIIEHVCEIQNKKCKKLNASSNMYVNNKKSHGLHQGEHKKNAVL
jgi:hypothetical protein